MIDYNDYFGGLTEEEYERQTKTHFESLTDISKCEHELEFVGASYNDFDTIHHYKCSKCGAEESMSLGI